MIDVSLLYNTKLDVSSPIVYNRFLKIRESNLEYFTGFSFSFKVDFLFFYGICDKKVDICYTNVINYFKEQFNKEITIDEVEGLFNIVDNSSNLVYIKRNKIYLKYE